MVTIRVLLWLRRWLLLVYPASLLAIVYSLFVGLDTPIGFSSPTRAQLRRNGYPAQPEVIMTGGRLLAIALLSPVAATALLWLIKLFVVGLLSRAQKTGNLGDE